MSAITIFEIIAFILGMIILLGICLILLGLGITMEGLYIDKKDTEDKKEGQG